MDAEGLPAGQAVVADGHPTGTGLPVGPDPEVRPGSGRRRFTAAYKQRIVAEAGRCAPGEVGALLRREGLYSSHLTKWRREFAAGAVDGSGKRAPAAEELRMARQRLAKAERENHRLRQQLDRAETIIAVQKKLSALLQIGPPEDEH
ncbi:MAG: transposase [Acidobacteriota bacterium]